MTITIQGPDGASIDFPDGTPEGEMNSAMAQAYPAPAQVASSPVMGALKGASRAIEANFPGIDRMVAAAKSRTWQPNDYASYLATEQAKNAQFAQQNPWTNAAGGAVASFPLVAATGGASTMGGAALQGAGAFGLGGLIQGAASSPDLTNTQDTGRRMAQGELTGGAIGAAVPLMAAGVGNAVSPLARGLHDWWGGTNPAEFVSKPGSPMGPAGQKLAGDVSGAYKNVENLGAAYSPDAVQSLVGKIASDAKDAYMNPKVTPAASSVIDQLQSLADDGRAVPLPELDKMRQLAGLRAGASPSAEERKLGVMIRSNIDDFIKNAGPEAMAPRPAPAPNFNPAARPDANYVPPGTGAGGGAAAVLQRPVNPGPAPIPLLDVMRNYGLQDEGGDLASMGFSNKTGVAGKGSSKVIDKVNGVPMDEGLRVAQELGYMEPHETVSDFINKLGEHPTYTPEGERQLAQRRAYEEAMGEFKAQPSKVEPPPEISAPAIPTSVPPAPSAADASSAIQNARDLAQRQFKAQAIGKALDKAEIRAETTGSYGNIENTTRQRLAALYEKEPWTPDEFSQLKKMAQGTPVTDTLSRVGKLSPFGHAVPAFADIAGAMLGHTTVPGAVSALGVGGQLGNAFARRMMARQLMDTVLAGGKAPATQAIRIPDRAAYAAALGARQLLSQSKSTQP